MRPSELKYYVFDQYNTCAFVLVGGGGDNRIQRVGVAPGQNSMEGLREW